jgi:hypothetical protein
MCDLGACIHSSIGARGIHALPRPDDIPTLFPAKLASTKKKREGEKKAKISLRSNFLQTLFATHAALLLFLLLLLYGCFTAALLLLY